jgi:hypothetical protein
VEKPKHEKSLKELQTQERKRADGLIGKAHQLVVKCDANVAVFVQYPRTGRVYSYRSPEDWPPRVDMEVGSTPTMSIS